MTEDETDSPLTLAEAIRRKMGAKNNAEGSAEAGETDPENLQFYSRYQFYQPLGQCARSIFYLARDKMTESHVIVKQYLSGEEWQKEQFEDEVHRLDTLKRKGLITFFDRHASDGKLFLVVDVSTACEWLCAHISKESIEKVIINYPR